MSKSLKEAKSFLLKNTKYVNELREKRNKAKTQREKKAYQTLIDIQDGINKKVKAEISKLESGLKAPAKKTTPKKNKCAVELGKKGGKTAVARKVGVHSSTYKKKVVKKKPTTRKKVVKK